MEAVGLSDRLDHRPAELSGGQVQRVACARALIARPAVVFADEPTGNLDSQATAQVLSVLRSAVDEFGQSVVMVTHEPEAAAWADTVIFLRDGHVVAEMNLPDQNRVLDALRELSADDGPSIGVGPTGRVGTPLEEAWSQPQRIIGNGAGQRGTQPRGIRSAVRRQDEPEPTTGPTESPWGFQ